MQACCIGMRAAGRHGAAARRTFSATSGAELSLRRFRLASRGLLEHADRLTTPVRLAHSPFEWSPMGYYRAALAVAGMPGFDPVEFVEAAKDAYRTAVSAVDREDYDALKQMVTEEVLEQVQAASQILRSHELSMRVESIDFDDKRTYITKYGFTRIRFEDEPDDEGVAGDASVEDGSDAVAAAAEVAATMRTSADISMVYSMVRTMRIRGGPGVDLEERHRHRAVWTFGTYHSDKDYAFKICRILG